MSEQDILLAEYYVQGRSTMQAAEFSVSNALEDDVKVTFKRVKKNREKELKKQVIRLQDKLDKVLELLEEAQ